MSNSTSARLDPRSLLLQAHPLASHERCEIIATVTSRTGPLVGVDRVLIRAGSVSLLGLARLRRRYGCPAILELPGPGTVGVTHPLTTSEYLVFASAEGFQTVCLQGASDVGALLRARELLHPEIRLGATLANPAALRESFGEICDAADLVLVDQERLERHVGEAALDHAQWALCEAKRRGARCLLAKGLLASLRHSPLPTQMEIDRIGALVGHGSDGFVLGDETAESEHPQAAVELLRSLLSCVLTPAPPLRHAARVAGRPTVQARALSPLAGID